MGYFHSLFGDVSTANSDEVKKELQLILIDSENVNAAFKLVRDLIVFTNKRFIGLDKQEITGKKIEYHSLPYKSISHFSIESAGRFDLDAELKFVSLAPNIPLSINNLEKITVFMIFKKI